MQDHNPKYAAHPQPANLIDGDRRVEACDRVKRGNPQGLDRKPITKPQTKPEPGR